MKRADLNRVDPDDFLKNRMLAPGTSIITMSTGQQWDVWLDVAYKRGFTVLELDENEVPVAAYQKKGVQNERKQLSIE